MKYIHAKQQSEYGSKLVSGKKAKKQKLTTLPNRINGELLNEIEFVANGTEVVVKRGQNPSVLELIENGIPNDRAGHRVLSSIAVFYLR